MKTRLCPVCYERRTASPHHVKPRGNRGTSDSRNVIMLCSRCHDIAESIYDSTGYVLSPYIIELIRHEFGFTDSNNPAQHDLVPTPVKTVRFHNKGRAKIDVPNIPMLCPYCGKYHYPGENGEVICQKLKDDLALERLTGKLRLKSQEQLFYDELRASIRNKQYKQARSSNT